MRGFAAGAIACAAALAAAPAASPHPGHGPTEIDIGEFAYAPQDALIYQGDSVVFTWKGPDTNHSATGDAFDSDAGRQPNHPIGDTYAVTFTKVGTFSYHCKVHSFMTGTVTVREAPAGPPAPGPPVLTKLRAAPRRFARKTTVRYDVDRPVSMRATLRRGSKVVKEIDFNSPPGFNKKTLDFGRKIKAGKYVLRLVAVDRTSGKSSKPASVAVEVLR
jgi:plastocyanin